jgi:hypothetical protein
MSERAIFRAGAIAWRPIPISARGTAEISCVFEREAVRA